MRTPDEIVGRWSKPQTMRWVLFRRPWLQVVLNRHLLSDAPVLHDHEWPNVTIVLRGRALEWLAYTTATSPLPRRLFPGRVVIRRAIDLHWLEVPKDGELWTLFITGRKVREFGYKRRDGSWTPWAQATDIHDFTRLRK